MTPAEAKRAVVQKQKALTTACESSTKALDAMLERGKELKRAGATSEREIARDREFSRLFETYRARQQIQTDAVKALTAAQDAYARLTKK